MKKKQPTKAERLAKAAKENERTLKRTGYLKYLAKHGASSRPDFPDLKVKASPHPSMGDAAGGLAPKKQLHPDAKQFPVGNSHKQGLELIYSAAYVSQMNGKKT